MALSPKQVDGLIDKAREQIDQKLLVTIEAKIDSQLLNQAKQGYNFDRLSLSLKNLLEGEAAVPMLEAIAALYREAGWDVTTQGFVITLTRKKVVKVSSKSRSKPTRGKRPW